MLTRSQYTYIKDSIINDPDLELKQIRFLMGMLFVYFKRDMQNFNQKRWLSGFSVEQIELIKECIDNDTGHTFENPYTKSNT